MPKAKPKKKVKAKPKKKVKAKPEGYIFGRPTKYGPATLAKTLKYIESCEDLEFELIKESKKGKGSYQIIEHRLKANFPMIEELAEVLDVNQDTIHEWAKHHADFSESLRKLKAKQARMLAKHAMSGDYNPTIAKLMLSTNHGYVEKSEDTLKGEVTLSGLFRASARRRKETEIEDGPH